MLCHQFNSPLALLLSFKEHRARYPFFYLLSLFYCSLFVLCRSSFSALILSTTYPWICFVTNVQFTSWGGGFSVTCFRFHCASLTLRNFSLFPLFLLLLLYFFFLCCDFYIYIKSFVALVKFISFWSSFTVLVSFYLSLLCPLLNLWFWSYSLVSVSLKNSVAKS